MTTFASFSATPAAWSAAPAAGTFVACPVGYKQAGSAPQGQTLKTFSDSTNVTFANSGTAASQTLDPASPFGATRLRVDCPSGNTWTEVQLHSVSVPAFKDGQTIAWRIQFDDWTKVTQIQHYDGNSGYANFRQGVFSVQSSSRNNRNGPLTIAANAMDASANTFTYGTHNLENLKLRVFTLSGSTCRFWVDSCVIVDRSRPKFLITFDDASKSWIDLAAPSLATYGFKATFGVGVGQVNTNGALYVTDAQLRTLQAAGHQIQAHNVTNTSYGTSGLEAYLAEYDSAVAQLRAWGITGDFMYHPYVQGRNDGTLMASLAARGVRVARGTDTFSTSVARYNYPSAGTYTDNLMDLKIGDFSAGGFSLAQGKTAIDNAIKYGATFVGMFHDLTSGAPTGMEWAASDFDALLAYANAKQQQGLIDAGITVANWYRGLTQPQAVA